MKKSERIQELEDHIYEICDIIHMQCPLKMQDAWVKSMMDRKLYDLEEDDDKILGRLSRSGSGEFIPNKPCCKNGCERCEQ